MIILAQILMVEQGGLIILRDAVTLTQIPMAINPPVMPPLFTVDLEPTVHVPRVVETESVAQRVLAIIIQVCANSACPYGFPAFG